MRAFWTKFVASLPIAQCTILIADGRVHVKRGQVRSALVLELQQLADANDIRNACIHASKAGTTGYKLSFVGIPNSLHQRFRNVWSANWR